MRRVLCLLLLAACDDDGDVTTTDAALVDAPAVDAAPDAAPTDAGPNGLASGTLKVFVSATFQYFPRPGGEPIEAFRALVDVRDLDDQPVDGANVQLELGGVVYDASPGDGPGLYDVVPLRVSPTIRVDVDRGADFLLGAMLRVPAEVVLEIAPDPPVHLQAATVAWPLAEIDTLSVAQVFDARGAPTHPSVIEEPEDGSVELPATAFPATGMYELRVERETTTALAGLQSTGKVRISTGKLLVVVE